ncbi:MAG TPA: general stress protein, partial [Pyrinomonadaceae bacterium]|nr:general stress protein [Pyrinomonadaceae bacterium]
MANKATLVTGLFKSRAAAEAAVDALIKRGYTRDDISVLMSDATRSKEFAVETRTHAADGAGIGGAVGGTIGAVLA